MYNKYWKSLIIEWRIKGKRGLSLPYIIGAQNFLNKAIPKQGIKELITEIVNDGQYGIYITYCTDLNTQILCLHDDSKKNLAGFYPTLNSEEQTIFFKTISLKKNETVEDIIKELIEDNQNYINIGKFSFRRYIREEECKFPFNADDRQFITSCFEKLTF